MTSELYELNCPFCDKLYKLPRDKVVKHVGKSIHCRKCGKPFSIPALPVDEAFEEPHLPVEIPIEEHTPAAQTESAPVEEPVPAESPASELSLHKDEPSPESEYNPPYPPFATDGALEPPPLSEYGVGSLELAAETSSEISPEREPDAKEFSDDFEDSLPASIAETLNEAPEASSYFSGAMIADDAPAASTVEEPEIAPISDVEAAVEHESIESQRPILSEPVPESESSGSLHEFSLSEEASKPVELVEETTETKAGDPQLPEPPSKPLSPPLSPPLPPKTRRGARATVSPVFDAQAEEPVARRRGKVGSYAAPIEPIETAADASVNSGESPIDFTNLESAYEEQAIESSTPKTDLPVDELESKADDVPTLSMEPERADRLSGANTLPSSPAPAASPQAIEDLSAIRRSLGLLATMSVIITLVLIAILLTLLGIIPKK